MIGLPLSSLRIENLRGAVTPFDLLFEKGKKLTIVYGENGTGKSTISDAFDLIGSGNVGSLDKRGVGGSTRSYWPTVGKKLSDVKVSLTSSAGVFSVTLDKSNVIVNDQNLKPNVAVLRRSQILNLIAAQPADRYKEIRTFIDVSGVESSEATLRILITDKTKDYDTATTRLDTNKLSIDHFWAESGTQTMDAFTWARAEVLKDRGDFEKLGNELNYLILSWDKITSLPTKWKELNLRFENAHKLHGEANALLTQLKNEAADDILEILDILKAAQHHFVKHPAPLICPLCESSERAKNLVDDVDRKLENQGLYSKLETNKTDVATKETVLKQEKQRLDDFLAHTKSDFESFSRCYSECANNTDLGFTKLSIPTKPEEWDDWIERQTASSKNWKQAYDTCVDSKKFIETLRRSLKEYDDSESKAKDLAAILPRLKEILGIVEAERKKYTDKILVDISKRVGELYETIHPSEGLDKIELALDTAKRGSLEIATVFAGKSDTPPQAYFSDSHLDTLGLCVFLALAEREQANSKILVLDDVLGSVDEPHVERVINLIYDVSQQFQHTIVTTHYRPWREKYRWGILKPDQVCQFVELKHWSIQDGIAQSGSKPETARLKALLESDDQDIQAITGKAGVILEAILDFLTLKYNCAVPRNPRNAYVLSELLSAINGKLLNALEVECVSVDAEGNQIITKAAVKPILEKIKEIAQARNVLGAHFNAISFDLYPQDGIKFARLVEQLADALICSEHGWPTKDTGSYWRNGGETRRLHPLTKPS